MYPPQMLEWKSIDLILEFFAKFKLVTFRSLYLDSKKLILTIGYLILSGLAMYGTWTTVATLLNLGSALIYRDPHWKQQTASSLSLGSW